MDPGKRKAPERLVIWLHGLTRSKEAMIPALEELADAGFVSLSFDCWQHGERGKESEKELASRVFGNFRRHMWPIIGNTVLDAGRVIDWALGNLNVSSHISMGGLSMGGDISIAAAGFDHRVKCVGAICSTPDWLRPGMQDYYEPGNILPQGEADSYADFFYRMLNPITHIDSYSHCPAMTFECGAEDYHVPPEGALRFQEALGNTYSTCPEKLRVTLHPDVGHAVGPNMVKNCIDWFAAH